MRRELGLGGMTGEAKRLGLTLVLLLAVFLQGLVPAGFMPNVDGAPGGSPIVICSADGMRLAPPPGDHAPAHRASHHEVCAFAGHAPAPGPAPIVAIATPAFVRLASPPRPEVAAPPSLRRHRDQAARAPPSPPPSLIA